MTVPQQNKTWRKSSRSDQQGACVELGSGSDGVRDSKTPDGPTLSLPWPGLVSAVKANQIR